MWLYCGNTPGNYLFASMQQVESGVDRDRLCQSETVLGRIDAVYCVYAFIRGFCADLTDRRHHKDCKILASTYWQRSVRFWQAIAMTDNAS